VIDELARSGAEVRALTRRPDDVTFAPDVDVACGDLNDPAALERAVAGVSAVFLVWTSPSPAAPEVIRTLTKGMPRIVYLSAPFRTPHPFFQQPNPMRDLHAEMERRLADAGADISVVRPGMFASNALHWWAPQIRVGNVVRWPHAGAATAPTDERDVAAVAARMLMDSGHSPRDLVVTGPESLTQQEQVRIIGEAIERDLQYEELSPNQFRHETQGTWPPGIPDMLLSAWAAAEGQPAFVTSAIEEVTGRRARTFRGWAHEHRNAFAAA
jgi:uncharacterized protein YbjT (DUF2867 family)